MLIKNSYVGLLWIWGRDCSQLPQGTFRSSGQGTVGFVIRKRVSTGMWSMVVQEVERGDPVAA